MQVSLSRQCKSVGLTETCKIHGRGGRHACKSDPKMKISHFIGIRITGRACQKGRSPPNPTPPKSWAAGGAVTLGGWGWMELMNSDTKGWRKEKNKEAELKKLWTKTCMEVSRNTVAKNHKITNMAQRAGWSSSSPVLQGMDSVRKHVGTGFINLSSPWSLCLETPS